MINLIPSDASEALSALVRVLTQTKRARLTTFTTPPPLQSGVDGTFQAAVQVYSS